MQNGIDRTDARQAGESYRFPTADPAVAGALNDVLRTGARRMLIQAVEAEAAAWIDQHAHVTDDHGRR